MHYRKFRKEINRHHQVHIKLHFLLALKIIIPWEQISYHFNVTTLHIIKCKWMVIEQIFFFLISHPFENQIINSKLTVWLINGEHLKRTNNNHKHREKKYIVQYGQVDRSNPDDRISHILVKVNCLRKYAKEDRLKWDWKISQ